MVKINKNAIMEEIFSSDIFAGWEYKRDEECLVTPIEEKIHFFIETISKDGHRADDKMQIKIRLGKEKVNSIITNEDESNERCFFAGLIRVPTDMSGSTLSEWLSSSESDSNEDGENENGSATIVDKELWFVFVEKLHIIPGNQNKITPSVRPVLLKAKDYFQQNSEEKTYRCAPKELKYTMSSAMVIRIKDNDYAPLKNYLMCFDNRPYRASVTSAIEYLFASISKGEEMKEENRIYPYNWLISGAPGTGKSFEMSENAYKLIFSKKKSELVDEMMKKEEVEGIDKDKNEIRKKLSNVIEEKLSEYVTRVTFYEDYSYENFVGCYKPVPIANSVAKIQIDGHSGTITDSKVSYEYEPGPFVDILVKALNDENHKKYCLLIEEINRAKAASVFGDIFQLLDRENGKSVYYLTPDKALNGYLERVLDDYSGTIRIPDNLYIWATMNSADQGVYPLDSAFKRRWSYKCQDVWALREGENVETLINILYKGKTEDILWDDFRNLINEKIAEEDCYLGPWYFSNRELQQISEYNKAVEEQSELGENPLVEKLFLYLRQDIFRHNPKGIFKDNWTMSQLVHMYRNSRYEMPSIDTVLSIDTDKLEKCIEKVRIEKQKNDEKANEVETLVEAEDEVVEESKPKSE